MASARVRVPAWQRNRHHIFCCHVILAMVLGVSSLPCRASYRPDAESKAALEINALESHLKSRDYAAWKARQPDAVTRALTILVVRLGSFEANDRARAATLLKQIGDDGVSAIVVAGLTHPNLAVRAGSYDSLLRILQEKYGMAPASIPPYDGWAPLKERMNKAQVMSKWWNTRRTTTKGRTQ